MKVVAPVEVEFLFEALYRRALRIEGAPSLTVGSRVDPPRELACVPVFRRGDWQ